MSSPARKPAADFARYLRTETTGGIVLLVATAIALLWANSPLGDSYTALRETHLGPLTIGDWVKDGLLAVFFFVAGLELKRELVVGELNSLKAAALPVIAAVGGMVVPALVALGFSWGEPGAGQAWAIPMATDIAFALGVLAIAGSALPSSVRVFLLSLAVVDDLGAIAVIAVLFTSGLELLAVLAAVALLALYAFLQHKRVTATWLYVPIAVGAWVAVHEAGVHATIAGVALGLLTRVRADEGEDEAPAARLEHRLQPWSAGLVVPLFALFAAGVPIGGDALRALVDDPIALGVVAGLVLGKVIGILGFSALAVRLRLAVWPSGAGPRDVAAVGVLGGVGFTVSLLIADLALAGEAAERAKAAVLIASLLASLIAAVLLVRRGRAHRDSD
ncbi:Na+/H+ antiporter NhaA [Actinosynnema mirum]|uniref:Na(+)/H(+) antiporter NhaA n=1 Tax=Actinosynnema mirum (strain ATCC 29888 / DSM 43827 / JCM 3225 / NBRC 14064 / NCIMB 13271 / NRRL B-12336 / IMRU 3971 / 101) TaxID=446462 RepID=C6WF98_ACTMD|nr:Na+/H+ antiporter NhaA [Actinosynnema mirum]ACU34230.1 Na+/H+ antiporter NhaA [Actinosynnema mirum DSM 43827]AXX27601.1 Na+/H+ antiporter NhaA type [Actinosynnema pretiosum subsp. pretiosum]